MERSYGPDHANVAATLERYATLLRKARKTAKADELDARAARIRAGK